MLTKHPTLGSVDQMVLMAHRYLFLTKMAVLAKFHDMRFLNGQE